MDQDLDFSRSQVAWGEQVQLGSLDLNVESILANLKEHLTPERDQRLREVVASRSNFFVSVLENIYDRGNVSAVMRSSEAFGFVEMALIDPPGSKFKAANRVTRGAEKWLDVKPYSSPETCVSNLRSRGYQVWATDLATEVSIDTLDWSKPMAIVLGNEKDGISPAMRAAVDGCFRIPMLGFSQSFNISVAAALVFYRAHLELRRVGAAAYLKPEQQQQLLANYYLRCFDNPEALLRTKLSSKM